MFVAHISAPLKKIKQGSCGEYNDMTMLKREKLREDSGVYTRAISDAWDSSLCSNGSSYREKKIKERRAGKRRSFSGFQTRKNELADFTRSDSFHPAKFAFLLSAGALFHSCPLPRPLSLSPVI